MPKEQNERFLPPFPLLSHLTHLTRSVPNNERRRRQLYQFPSSKKAHSSLQRIFLPKRLRETRASVAKRSTVAVFTQPLREKYFFLSTLDPLTLRVAFSAPLQFRDKLWGAPSNLPQKRKLLSKLQRLENGPLSRFYAFLMPLVAVIFALCLGKSNSD